MASALQLSGRVFDTGSCHYQVVTTWMALNGLFCADVPLRNYSLGWVSVRGQVTISVYNQPPRLTQPSITLVKYSPAWLELRGCVYLSLVTGNTV